MLINKENLIKAGYSEFQSVLNGNNDFYLYSYQKKVLDEIGVKYFINLNFFDMTEINEKLGIQFSSEVQFNLQNEFTFDVHGHYNKELTISELEMFYENIWKNMNCKYYE